MSKRRQIITAGGPKLQAPALPVEVTSGELGPGAAYSAKNWGGTIVWAYGRGGAGPLENYYFGEGEQAGDIVVASCYYLNTDRNLSVTFNSEINVNRIFYNYDTNLAADDFGHFFGMWEMTAAFGASADLEVTLGPSYNHNYSVAVMRGFSEFY